MDSLEPRRPSEGARVPRYLPALDGLRALSVLAVIAFHAELPRSQGGFLGVEVFFVVSGYLITQLLLEEQRLTGRISLPDFWLRRARRLLPALFALLLAALALSLTIAPDSLAGTRSDALAALFYVSNWWQVIHHHSYFMDVDRPPLLLHLWSLSVEEQFYLFWPLAVALFGRSGQRWVLRVALLGGTASALWLAWQYDPSADPTRVYVGSDTRLSGLLLGAALAVITSAFAAAEPQNRPTRLVRETLGVTGALALGWLIFHSTSHDPFLYRGGLVLVDLASAALIAGLLAPTALSRLLGAGPCAWLGRRSYGLYLWHWPIFAVTRPELDLALTGAPLLGLRLALTFVAAELCYRFVELPIRAGALSRMRTRPWLLGASGASLAALSLALVSVSGARLADARVAASPSASSPGALASASPALPELAAAPPVTVANAGVPLDPAWPKTLTLLSDSVGLGLSRALPAALPGWKVEILGRPALMVKQVVPEFLNARAVGSVVVIALGYNSLFERDRKNYAHWSGIWDRSAERLLSDLKACGAKKLVWITLREPSADLVTDAGRDQYERYAWFFPYVNERVRALAARHPELMIADWQAVSNLPDLTKDLIHLSPSGVSLLTETVTRAVLGSDADGRARP
ncbi:MAG: acyltransferase family protein [Pseudomonadota bacterium]